MTARPSSSMSSLQTSTGISLTGCPGLALHRRSGCSGTPDIHVRFASRINLISITHHFTNNSSDHQASLQKHNLGLAQPDDGDHSLDLRPGVMLLAGASDGQELPTISGKHVRASDGSHYVTISAPGFALVLTDNNVTKVWYPTKRTGWRI